MGRKYYIHSKKRKSIFALSADAAKPAVNVICLFHKHRCSSSKIAIENLSTLGSDDYLQPLV